MRWLHYAIVLTVILSHTWAEPKKSIRDKKVLKEFLEQDNEAVVDEEAAGEEGKSDKRTGKLFSLFNIVQFKNSGCKSQSTLPSTGTGSFTRNGTCYTTSQCSTKGGTASGNCAAGFGVCCLFLVSASGATITQNCTYIRNPNYPSSYTGTSSISYTIKKCSGIVCRLRLDFESFTIQGTGATTGTNGGQCKDTFTATVNTNQQIPVVCGQNTGMHMFLDLGNQASDSATLSFNFGSSTTSNRNWEIKVTQIPCCGATANNANMPPPGCLQYFTGLTGRITTFNFIPTNDNALQNQNYNICIRSECGYCCIQYMPCSDPQSYSLTANQAAAAMKALVDSNCFIAKSLDFIMIEGAMGSCIQGNQAVGPQVTKLCGGIFSAFSMATVNSAVCTCTQPFQIGIYTNSVASLTGKANTMVGNTQHQRGDCLTYMQIPCTS